MRKKHPKRIVHHAKAVEREKMLQNSEKRSTQIIEGLPVAIFVVDSKGKPCYQNKLARELLKKEIDKLGSEARVGQLSELCHAYLVGTEQLYPANRSPLARALAGEYSTVDDVEIRHPDRTISLEVSAAPILDEEGRVAYAVAAFRDITKRKKDEETIRRQAEEIRALNQNLSQRLVQMMLQMDGIGVVREKVRKAPDVSTGLGLIVDATLKDLDMDAGTILIIDHEKNNAEVQSFRSNIEGLRVNESYPLNARFAEFEVIGHGKNISRVVGQGEQSILKTTSLSCVPILLGKALYGVLALGSQKGLTLDDSDLVVLSLYAELASNLFQIQSLTVTPTRETSEAVKREFELEFGKAYLVKNDVEKTFTIFVDQVLGGFDGLVITREFPPKIRKKYEIEKTPVVWLTEEQVKDQQTVRSLQDLSVMISSFLEKTKRSVVLLDGFEYLITTHGFGSFMRFLQMHRSRFEQNDSILIAPLSTEALAKNEVALIEREMKLLEAQRATP